MGQLKSILAITDMTRASDACLIASGRLAQSSGSEFHVFGSPPFWPGMAATLRSIFMPRGFAKAQARLLDEQISRACAGFAPDSRVAHTHLFADVFIAHAHEVAADLIVISRSVDIDVATEVAEKSGRPTLLVRQELPRPIHRAVMPIMTPEPDRDAVAAAVWWVEQLHGMDCRTGNDHVRAELELLQMAGLARESGVAAATIRGALPDRWGRCDDPVKISWRAAGGAAAKSRLRNVALRSDSDLIISPIRARQRGRMRLTAATRLLLVEANASVLLLPLVPARIAVAV